MSRMFIQKQVEKQIEQPQDKKTPSNLESGFQEDSNTPLIKNDGQLVRLSFEVKQEIIANEHAIMEKNEDDVYVIEY